MILLFFFFFFDKKIFNEPEVTAMRAAPIYSSMCNAYLTIIIHTLTLISHTYIENGFFQNALDTLARMDSASVLPTLNTFTIIFTLCGKLQDPELANHWYDRYLQSGLASDEKSVASAISMFSKCELLGKARDISILL